MNRKRGPKARNKPAQDNGLGTRVNAAKPRSGRNNWFGPSFI
jgi:hypothetical protein